MTRFTARVLAVLGCGLILGAPGSAIGSVVPNACIAGIGLWDSREQVAREWGPPTSKVKDWQQRWWEYPKGTVYFVLLRNRWIAVEIRTTDRRERLSGVARLNGLGVGSWRNEVHAATGGQCRGGSKFCQIASSTRGGTRTTTVHFDGPRGKRVIELSISDDSWWEDGATPPDTRCRSSQ